MQNGSHFSKGWMVGLNVNKKSDHPTIAKRLAIFYLFMTRLSVTIEKLAFFANSQTVDNSQSHLYFYQLTKLFLKISQMKKWHHIQVYWLSFNLGHRTLKL